MYPASSCKALYLGAIYDIHKDNLSPGISRLAEPTLVESKNDTYEALLDYGGLRKPAKWISEVAPYTGGEFENTIFPNTTAEDMCNIWEKIYETSTDGSSAAQEFTGFLEVSKHSPMGEALRDESTVWSKPGWYPDDGLGYTSSNDAGIVFSEKGPYVMVVLTNAPADFQEVKEFASECDLVHDALCSDCTDVEA